jgi:hypothetical protein
MITFPKLVQNFRTSKAFYHIQIEYNVHDVLRKVVVYYTKKNLKTFNGFLVMI